MNYIEWDGHNLLIKKNFSFWHSATSQRTSLGLGSQNGFYTDQPIAPPKLSHL
jgi:hypothetical protein